MYTRKYFHNTSIQDIKAANPVGIILSGGPASVLTEGALARSKDIFIRYSSNGYLLRFTVNGQTIGGRGKEMRQKGVWKE